MGTLSTERSGSARFDDVTRSVAAASSRRSALRVMASGIGGMVLSGLGIKTSWAAGNCLCNGRVYTSEIECCTPSGIVPKHPIADLNVCPNRVANKNHTCKDNGCGGTYSSYIVPDGYFGVDFYPACKNHDCCYDKCKSIKSGCDTDFLSTLTQACNNAFPGAGYVQQFKRSGCLSTARVYYDAVNTYGSSSYEEAQQLSCDCCDTQTCRTCAGGSCGSLPSCAGGGDCVCFTTPQGEGVCIHGNTPCAGLSSCSSNADCPPGYGCAATSCCGGGAVCGPLCSDVNPAGGIAPRAKSKSGKTMAG